ncbi:MAG: 2-C-methyl-D-erythritol 4-phosphate cytidylyltransferase [Candidatus Omnitrophica bacterium]|nr:2-C-methyl-D-erythritol 4-phosphate cytidylyltransferase [Candidatus Omnitrophota bacterium]
MSVWAIVPTAGTGERFGGTKPKPLADLNGKPVIARTLLALEACVDIDSIVVVAHTDWIKDYQDVVRKYKLSKVKAVVAGGATRTQSVRQGLVAVGKLACTVMVHDGVRPLVSSSIIQRGLDAVNATGAAVAAVRVKPTIKVVELMTGLVQETLDRDLLWEIQTPQIFERRLLERAYAADQDGASDDAALVERLGVAVKVFEGAYTNIKITTPEDMLVAQAFLANISSPED